ncbi:MULTISPECIES: cell division topological specificity factor MinE [Spongiibacter]|jgi:cell division topological specificity factor|uniref:cell division topological specificity factor MinE n=1 Tax=Spongiibacter TaxID=630749 RepID=UPI0003B41255|nr:MULTISPECIES: cell division topological specificity factor MinE [Spongiibacter]MAY38872.1 cell division topological specificity factor MinE [Spongiibacter sp.]MBI57012.1 cell division topological specificity factor MinE [Spongiibacter sp.]MBO6751474.1 cell division topological specificity factor MinE [Spongiibacter sp.]MBU72068.1 cell division topological specificity factor MinE [Spongiibacter sp.]|tara:strand:+ start:8995 stop:9246 length:252 start_codon:yes stop_codon:yes gene_type:complete
MSILDFFRSSKKESAAVAKERLQIIVAHERNQRNQPDYLPKLQQELLEVIRKYVEVNQDQVEVALDNNGNCSVLELNITLPDR